MSNLIGDPTWLFDFAFPVLEFQPKRSAVDVTTWNLGPEYAHPNFRQLNQVGGTSEDVIARLAWSSIGFFVQVDAPMLQNQRGGDARPVHLIFYIDCRGTPNLLRANQYCHLFRFYTELPVSPKTHPEIYNIKGSMGAISRATDHPPSVDQNSIACGIVPNLKEKTFSLRVFLSRDQLHGYQPEDYSECSVAYVYQDSFLPTALLARSENAPIYENPSLWSRVKHRSLAETQKS